MDFGEWSLVDRSMVVFWLLIGMAGLDVHLRQWRLIFGIRWSSGHWWWLVDRWLDEVTSEFGPFRRERKREMGRKEKEMDRKMRTF